MGQFNTAIYFLMPLVTSVYSQQNQFVQFFATEGCTGEFGVQQNETGYQVVGADVTYASFKLYGLWRVHLCPAGCVPPFPSPILENSMNGICTNQEFPSLSVIQLTRFGNDDQSAKSISFFTSTELTGDEIAYTGDLSGINRNYNSYFFTGANRWTLFEGGNFNGTSKCVSPSEDVVTNGFGATYVGNEIGVLGSIREGCEEQSTATTTQATTTTMATTTMPTTTTIDTTTATMPTTTIPTTTTIGTTTTGAPIPPQYVTLYADENCEGAAVQVTSSGAPMFPMAHLSFEAFGLWRLHPCAGVDCTNAPLQAPTLGQSPVCVNRILPANNMIAITRFGDPEQTRKFVVFYSTPELNGTMVTYAQDTEVVDFEYGSYFFNGDHSWTIFEENSYQGSSVCITPDEEVSNRGYGLTYEANLVGKIGSIREGCEATTGSPQTTVVPTTTTGAPIVNQNVILYTDAGCQGESVTLTGSGGPTFPTSYSSFAAFGLWRLYSCPGADCSAVQAPAPTYAYEAVCVDRSLPSGNMIAVSRFGDPDQISKVITFYSTPELSGAVVSIRADNEAVNFEYRSYFYTGRHSWTVFEGPNYTGESTCLVPEQMVDDRGYGVSYVANEVGTVGSIREGCTFVTGSTTTITTTAPTTTTLTTTTTPIPTTSTISTTTLVTTSASTVSSSTTTTTDTITSTTEPTTISTNTTTTNATIPTSTSTMRTTPRTIPTTTGEPTTVEASTPDSAAFYVANVWLVLLCLPLYL